MGKALSNQLAGLNQWLKEKDKYIAGMLKQHEEMKKSPIPSTSSEIDKYKKQARILNDFAQNMGTLDSEFREMVKNWATPAKLNQLSSDIVASKGVLNELKDLGISLEKVSGQSANTVLGNLKERFSKIDGWVGLGKEVGGMGSSISGTI